MDEEALARLYLALATGGLANWDRVEDELLPGPHCLSLARWRTALLREDRTKAEAAHVRDCRYCQQTEAQVRRELWHPSTVQLFWQALGLSGGEDEEDVAYHLQQDRCQRCLRLLTLLEADRLLKGLAEQMRAGVQETSRRLREALESWGILRIPWFQLPNPRAAAASSADEGSFGSFYQLWRERAQGEADLSATLAWGWSKYALEVKTQNAAWNRQLLRYVFEDSDGQPALQGFVLLRPDVNDWFVAVRTFQPQELYDAVHGECRELRVHLVDLQDLTAEDHALVLASARADRQDAEAWAAWRSWAADILSQGDRVSNDLRQLAQQVESL